VDRSLLLRAWGFLGAISAALIVGAFFFTLWRGGWTPGAMTGAGSHLHHVYLQATTTTFVAIVACQVGTALASRTDVASLRAIGLTSNPLLLWGIGFEIAVTALLVAVPGIQSVFGTAVPPLASLLIVVPFPVMIWAADELRRTRKRRRSAT
jgi:magnesium-transporting ATPase (P-type)